MEIIMQENFKKVNVKVYLKKIREKFFKNPNLWYEVIIPREAAERLYAECKGDYSLIWHAHCFDCFEQIDNRTDEFYLSEDESEWLCKHCYEKRLRTLNELK